MTDLPFPDSLCHRCVHLRLVTSGKASTFLMCREPTLPKYRSQPVRACPGFRAAGTPAGSGDPGDPGDPGGA